MSLETMTKIGTYTVGAGGISSFSFSGIPQTYTDLIIKVSARVSGSQAYAEAALYIQFNSDTTAANYKYAQHWGLGSGTVGSNNGSNFFFGNIEGGGMTANVFSTSEVCIPNYSGNSFKTTMWSSTEESSTANATIADGLTKWSNTAPITSITIFSDTNSFVQYSTFTLYGVKSMRAAAGNSIKATGGSVNFDGTYVTHTFNSTGSFTPTTNLRVDYLVVAGGGSGGTYAGGGGGAGGFKTSIGGSSLSLTGNTLYAVTVGAGGAASSGFGNNGSNSAFSNITSTGGGGGAGNTGGTVGGSGGSGGGGSGTTAVAAGGAGTAGEGNNGGSSGGGSGGGGGGGGAGAVGANATPGGANGGNGGVGLTSSISGSSLTYAGGGGGAGTSGGSGNGGLGGGGKGNVYQGVNAVAGTVNTGGGGGGDWVGLTGAAGGSGIVIIRYKG
jgi:hypothetical protein